ncbi:TetR/AcrR family transcriptional regulator [Amycolatopsis jejuensis]|uniref:TetR/AcrR family transcriptional regulator n=1 Tax=Amycolatopsis jejuensis TaxID=330084 RepID=UPI00068EF22C|nr:TetR/AcrR family transcriptional regulator [Amycolatopsis jejuensis]
MPAGASAREQILDAAAALFARQGFSATTTRQIAEAAGLEQGSMFHYFPRKLDILGTLLDMSLPAVEHVAWLDGVDLPASEKLYLLCYRDTAAMCAEEHNLSALLNLPEAKPPNFEAFWAEEKKLRAAYSRYIAEGLADGSFGGMTLALATEMVIAMVESPMQWFRSGRDDAAETATAVASAALRLLLADRGDLDDTVARALDHLALAPSPAATGD